MLPIPVCLSLYETCACMEILLRRWRASFQDGCLSMLGEGPSPLPYKAVRKKCARIVKS